MSLWDRISDFFRKKREQPEPTPTSTHVRTFRSSKLNPEYTKTLNKAIRANSRGGNSTVQITYIDAKGATTTRNIKPLGVKNTKLLGAHCHTRDGPRSFRVERIKSMKTASAFWNGFEKRSAPKIKAKDVKFTKELVKLMPGYIQKGLIIAKSGLAASGALGGAITGSGIPFIVRARFEDKFKEPQDRDMLDEVIAKGPVLGALAGAALGGYKGWKTIKIGALKPSVQLKEHQEHFIKKLNDNDGSLLAAHATGTGKTLTGIAGFEDLKKQKKAKKALVVVPASLRENFAQNLNKFTNSSHSTYGPKGERKSLDIGQRSKSDYNIVSYELFREHGDKLLEDTGADTLIMDEIHRVRGTEGTTYNKIRDLRPKFRNAITLTGSIVNNEPNDVVPLLDITFTPTGHKMVSKKFFDKLFVNKETVTKGILKPKVYVDKKIKNKRQLGQYMQGKVHFVSHESLEKEMPKRDVETVKCHMTPEQQKLYNYTLSSVDPITRWKIKNNIPVGQKEAKDAFSKLLQARQVATDPAVLDKSLADKDPYEYSSKVKNVVDDLTSHLGEDKGNKSVIFGNLIKGQIDAVEQALKKKGIGYSKFLGMGQEGMTAKKRPKEIEDFQRGKKRVLVISGAGAEGLDLKNTTMMQMLEGHYNPERIQQAEARVRRMGSFADKPPEERKVKIKRYVSKPKASPISKVMKGLGFKAGDQGVDEWIYSIADKKDSLNTDFREALEKAPMQKQGASPYKGKGGDNIKTDIYSDILDEIIESKLRSTAFSSYGTSLGGVATSRIGKLLATPIERRLEGNVEKEIKQRLLDKGKDHLLQKKHYPKILAKSKFDERMVDASLGAGALAIGLTSMGFISPKIRKAISYLPVMGMETLAKHKPLQAKSEGLKNAYKELYKVLKDEKLGRPLVEGVVSGATMGLAGAPLTAFAKTKMMQAAIGGRDQDLERGIALYEDQLRRKAARKYKSSKGYVNEYETKTELGIDTIE